MARSLIAILGVWAVLPMLEAHAAGNNKPAGCLIEPDQVADVGSSVTGVIEDLPVALGDAVEAGQTVVKLRAEVERANANVATLRAQVDAEVKAAQANWDLARQKVRRTEKLLEQNFMSAQALEQAKAESDVAEQKLRLAQSQQRIYAREETVAQAQVGLRTLRSPIKGVVVERYSNLGERVEERPVVRIAAIDPLRVSLMVPIAQYGQVIVGSTLTIRPELPGSEPVAAIVTYVDKVVDAASNTFRVRLSLPNPGYRLPGGLRCKADLTAQAAPQAAPPAQPLHPAQAPQPQPLRPAAQASPSVTPPVAARALPPPSIQPATLLTPADTLARPPASVTSRVISMSTPILPPALVAAAAAFNTPEAVTTTTTSNVTTVTGSMTLATAANALAAILAKPGVPKQAGQQAATQMAMAHQATTVIATVTATPMPLKPANTLSLASQYQVALHNATERRIANAPVMLASAR